MAPQKAKVEALAQVPPPDDSPTSSGAGAIPPPPDSVSPSDSDATFQPPIYFCGLQRNGPGAYAVVVGTIDKTGKLDFKTDHINQDLGNAADALRSEFQKLMGQIP